MVKLKIIIIIIIIFIIINIIDIIINNLEKKYYYYWKKTINLTWRVKLKTIRTLKKEQRGKNKKSKIEWTDWKR
jgi:hypothetical protein